MTRVLVLGQTGMVGQALWEALRAVAGLEVSGTDRRTPGAPCYLDAREGAADLRTVWGALGRFDYVVNAIGVTRAALDERDPASVDTAIAVNSLFPRALAAFAAGVGTRVIHLSTDGVFSGRFAPYAEDGPHDCVDVYGKTKSLGEVPTEHVLTLRCSVIGLDPLGRRGLLEWFLGLPDGKEVTGYTDHRWNGVTTLQLAALCREIFARGCFDRLVQESPVHHFCPTPAVTKYELLCAFNAVFGRAVVVRPGSSPEGPIDRTLVSGYRGLAGLLGDSQPIVVSLQALAIQAGRAVGDRGAA